MKINGNKRGISLIVLIITILVMIIIAAAIILYLDDTKIVKNANRATRLNNIAVANETRVVAKTEWRVNEAKLRDEGFNSFKDYLEYKLEEAEISNVIVKDNGDFIYLYVDSNGDSAAVPSGFVVSEADGENTIQDGLVIYEGNEAVTDKNVQTAKSTRNQFVWVPVPNFAKFERTTTYDGVTITDPGNHYAEPYKNLSLSNDPTGEWAEWTEMRASVQKYGGFYIGRYEAGTSEPRTSSATVTDVLVQKNKDVYNYVMWGTSMTEIGRKGAVYLARNLYDTSSVKSTLCYSVQWDAALTFISTKDSGYATNSSRKGNYTGTLLKTGSSEEYAVNNIYDMAGNVYEWTMEAVSSSFHAVRGGHYNVDGASAPAFFRSFYNSDGVFFHYGFRVALYIK